MEGADQPARERAPVTQGGHRVARQGDQPESTAPNPNERGPDRGPAAREDRELSRTSRADTTTLAQIAGTGTEVTHTPRRKTALDRKGPLNAMVATGDTKEDNSSVNLDGTPTLKQEGHALGSLSSWPMVSRVRSQETGPGYAPSVR